MKINVNLYNTMDKKNPCRAEIIECDKCEHCSLYKKGLCLNVTVPFSNRCKFGKVNKIKGYTQRAMKYYDFYNKYKSDEKYGIFSYPYNFRYAEIDNYIVLNLTYTIVDKKYYNYTCDKWEEVDNYKVRKSEIFSTNEISYITKEDFTNELLYKICTYKPHAMMGGEITEYQKKIIPDMLLQMRREFSERYISFITEYPEFNKEPNYIDKEVYINTMVNGSKLNKDGNTFIFNDGYLVCEDMKWNSIFFPFNDSKGTTAFVKIKVTDNMTYNITDNNQVNENTKFKE